MDVMSIRVDREIRSRMADMGDVNWSEVVRQALRERIELEEDLRRPLNRKRALRAARGLGLLRQRSKSGFDSTEEVRNWRDSRR